MTNVQNWLNEKYPQSERNQVEEIDNAYGEELNGELTIENFPNLKRVFLASNKNITKLTVDNCPCVEEIDVPDNQITELTINELANLEALNCNNNQLNTLDISQNTKLKFLFCSANPQLNRENFKGLEGLTQLKQFSSDEELQPIAILEENSENQIQQIEQQSNQIQNSLNQQITDLTNERNDLSEELNNLTLEIENEKNNRLTTEKEEISRKLTNEQNKTTYLQNELNTQRGINITLQRQKEDLEQDLNDFDLGFKSLEESKEVTERALKNAQEENDEYKTILQEKLDKLEKLQAEHEIAIKLGAKEQNNNQKLAKKLEKVGNKFGGKLAEIRQLKEQLQNQKELQNEIQQLKVKLVNYVHFVFQGILVEQEKIKNLTNTNSNNWLIVLERQQKLINQLKEIFSNELNNEQLTIFLQLQEQLTSLQTQLYKIQIKKTEGENILVQMKTVQSPFYN